MTKFRQITFFLLLVGCAHQKNEQVISHGEQQVVAMLQARPQMSAYLDQNNKSHEITTNDEIWKWLASRFDGSGFGKPIKWSPDIPISSDKCFFANHSYIKNYIKVAINYPCGLSKGKKLPFDYLWRLATFELLNIEGASEFAQIQNDALACKLNKEDYVRRNLLIEYAALVKQINFYKNVWRPWVFKKSVKSDDRYWRSEIEPFDEWLERLKKSMIPNGLVHWRSFYDRELMANNNCSKWK